MLSLSRQRFCVFFINYVISLRLWLPGKYRILLKSELFVNYTIVRENQELARVCQAAIDSEVVMLDSEFVRVRTFYPQLGLIQMYDGHELALIDPTVLSDMTPFVALLKNESVLKVLHACGEDLEVFLNAFSCTPTPLIDTQIMAAFQGYGLSTGFAALVSDLCDIELDKSESRTDWLARPLTMKQLEYAAADVYYLLPVYQALKARIEANKNSWWAASLEESQRQAVKRSKIEDPEQVYLNVKGAWQLKPEQLAILKLLACWRYQEAVKRDLALNFVLKEADMLTIAKYQLTSAKKMIDAGIDSRAVNRHYAKINQLVKQGQAIPAALYPEPIVPLYDMPGYKQLFKLLKDEVKLVVEKTQLTSEFIASKKQLNQLISWVWKKEKNEAFLPDLMCSWRKSLIGERLLTVIEQF